MSNKRFRIKAGPLAFLDPSGVQHQGRTYEDHYSQIHPDERALPLNYIPPTDADIQPAKASGKGAPAGKKMPRHQHQWLIRYDYMQCKSCGKLVDIKKDRGSVDQ